MSVLLHVKVSSVNQQVTWKPETRDEKREGIFASCTLYSNNLTNIPIAGGADTTKLYIVSLILFLHLKDGDS